MFYKLFTLCGILIINNQAISQVVKPDAPPAFSNSTLAQRACTDLYSAACLDETGKNKFKDDLKNAKESMKAKINQLRDQAAREMGYTDYKDAVKKRLQEKGLMIAGDAELEHIISFTDKANAGEATEDKSSLFVNSKQCNDITQLLEDRASTTNKLSDLNLLYIIAEKNKYHQRDIVFSAASRNLVDYFNSDILTNCQSIEIKPDLGNLNARWVDLCKNVEEIKNEIIDIERLSSPQKELKSNEFIKKYGIDMPPFITEPPLESESQNRTEAIKSQIENINESSRAYCTSIDSIQTNQAVNEIKNLLITINSSKTNVEGLIDHVYSGDNFANLKNSFENINADMQSYLGEVISDKKMLKTIRNQYADIKFLGMEKPPASSYARDPNTGVLILKEESAFENQNENKMSVEPYFFDPGLNYFLDLNASYSPKFSLGTTNYAESLTVQPLMINMTRNSDDVYSVIGHELGHKIDPDVSRINGHNTNSYFNDLINCYKDRGSIFMQNGQSGEVLSDYIGSELIAAKAAREPEANRVQTVFRAVEFFCRFEAGSDAAQSLSLNGTDVHPNSKMRINGIYAANPSIRRTLGCTSDSPKFKTCGLSKSILDMPEVINRRGSNSTNTNGTNINNTQNNPRRNSGQVRSGN